MAVDGEEAPLRPGEGRDVLRVASLNVNGTSVDSKRKEVMEGIKKRETSCNWSTRNTHERMWCNGVPGRE